MRLDILKKAVDKKFGLDIATRSRKRKYVYPRKVFCKLARDTRVTFREIGNEINTQHDLVVFHCNTVDVIDYEHKDKHDELIDELGLVFSKPFTDIQKAKIKKEIDSKKTDKAKQKYKEILEVGMKILRPNRQGLYFAIASYITLQTAKKMLLSKLDGIQSIGSFMRTKDGYKVTSPEGYVAINKGNAVKLVDRLVFSQANFNVAKDWVKG